VPKAENSPEISMSALPPKADNGTQSRDVRFVPKADIAAAEKASFKHRGMAFNTERTD
jgi:hypothetical protein